MIHQNSILTKQTSFEFAEWVERLPESEIRRLLRFSPKYYFAGGKPGILPVNIFHKIISEIIEEEKSNLNNLDDYNYGITQGNPEFRKVLMNRLKKNDGVTINNESDVIVSTGSQQMLYALNDIFINPGDVVLVTKPTYLGFLSPAEKLGANIITIPSDEGGIIPEYIDSAISLSEKKFGKKPKLLYTIPYADNPAGTTLSDSRKKEIVDIAFNHNELLVVEDVAYKEIRFNNNPITSMKSFDKDNEKIAYLSTSSKEAAVFRVGYSVIPPTVKEAFIKIKGYYDLNTPEWTQKILTTYYRKYIDQVLPEIRKGYQERAQALVKALDEYMPFGSYNVPKGGFFVWYEMNYKKFDSLKFISSALEKGVSYVPGKPFFPMNGFEVTIDEKLIKLDIPTNTLRLGYSLMNPEMITEGIKLLGSLLTNY
jgi:2-aminoadipate transaminase